MEIKRDIIGNQNEIVNLENIRILDNIFMNE